MFINTEYSQFFYAKLINMLTDFKFDNFLHSLCFRRSLSPISMRPSTLGPVKRKCDMDDYEPISKKWGLLISNNRYVI